MTAASLMDDINSEIFFLITLYLEQFLPASSKSHVIPILKEAIENNNLLPKIYDWKGKKNSQSFERLVSIFDLMQS